ncbi:DNA-processing protein DprA [Corynebacterium uberis]|uniref:DNA-processing protein DprA n=1 Tax=Corynebacterium uberis TaxID=2883169 RepID=UPI001D0AB4F1|nr:DNA-processing protein DprA [Corynebacterium uberis]UDL77247.1 DNA-processing protein DprA [Corynebacterium uberis]
MSWTQEQLAWAYLSRVVEGPSRELTALLAGGASAVDIARGVAGQEDWIGDLARQTASRRGTNRAEHDLEAAAAVGAQLIHPGHEQWPAEQLDHAFGFAASGCSPHIRSHQADAVAPHALWVRGGVLPELLAQAVSVVGTRAMTSYGAQATGHIVRGLAAHQWTIISGGALGVDCVAHEQALAAGGSTIVVSACGIDRFYPARNRTLCERIASGGGAVVSEYPPGVTPQRHRFLTRNRLVAALSAGTVVIEASWRSGALNTLSWAEGLGRVTMAVPGPITGPGSLGCHQRIMKGQAQLVCSADEVRGLLSAVGAVTVEDQYELQFGADTVQGLSRNELRVFDALPVRGEGGSPGEEIAATAGLPIALVMHVLVELRQRGVVELHGSAWQRAAG